jgi:hypothetical protein
MRVEVAGAFDGDSNSHRSRFALNVLWTTAGVVLGCCRFFVTHSGNHLLLFEGREVNGSRGGLLKLPDPGFSVAKRTTTGGLGAQPLCCCFFVLKMFLFMREKVV